MRLREGRPYVLSHGIADQRDLERAYRDQGFPNLVLTITPEFSAEGREVRLRVTVTEGPQIVVGDIVVVGRQQISEAAVREALTLRTGEPLGEAAELESRRRLLDLGIFRRVSITAQDLLPGETVANVLVSVEELPATTVGFGGGLEVGRRPRAATGGGNTDVLELSPRGFFEIGRRNLGGRNRSVNLFSRLALKPRTEEASDPAGPDVVDTRRFGFTEYRITGSFREQRAFHTDADLTIDVTSEQGVRTLFNFARQAVNASVLRRVSPRVTLSGRYGLDFSRLFDVGIQEADRSLIDRLFPQVRLSILSGGVLWDRRDDPVAPSTGTLMTANLEVAARSLGSEVGYAKTFFLVSAFRPLTDKRRGVFAARAQVGLARGFERTVPVEDALGAPVVDASGQPVTETVADLPASQRFFAGGGTTVRGFQIDRLGVPEILNPNGLSNGGNAVVVLNAELRAVVLKLIGRDLGVVGFTDAGNVFARAGDLDVGRLRATAGLGLRFDSPIGPLRFDVGLKFRRMDVGGRRERGWEYHLSIGEAF
jgi:outer membrane protein insertion porin family/translocation and assembly module TamA